MPGTVGWDEGPVYGVRSKKYVDLAKLCPLDSDEETFYSFMMMMVS